MIELQVDAAIIAHDAGPPAKGEPHLHLDAEVFLPEQLAVEVVDEKAARAEECVNPLAVGGGRIRREAAIEVVVSLVRRGSHRRVLPEDLASGAIDGEDLESMFLVGATATPGAAAPPGFRRRRSLASLLCGNCRCHEDTVA